MIEALNMQLHAVRVVLKNSVNEIKVCVDKKRDSGAFYTMISIFSSDISRKIAEMIAKENLFHSNNDFVGTLTHRGALCLVFHYYPENRLSDRIGIYAQSFVSRKNIAWMFLAACAETQITGSIGELLIEKDNVHFVFGGAQGKVIFNYFLDFSRWSPESERFFAKVAKYVFNLLTGEYAQIYKDQADLFPNELQVFYRKIGTRGFSSFNQILAAVQALPDSPQTRPMGVRRVWLWITTKYMLIKSHSMAIFLTLLVLVTLGYTSYQIGLRVNAKKLTEKNTNYIGMETIGEVYLGEETI